MTLRESAWDAIGRQASVLASRYAGRCYGQADTKVLQQRHEQRSGEEATDSGVTVVASAVTETAKEKQQSQRQARN